MNDTAQTIIKLWDEYMKYESRTRVFQPTMTDFIRWMRERYTLGDVLIQENEQSFKGGANTPSRTPSSEPVNDPAIWSFNEPDKGLEASAAKCKKGVLTRDGVREVRRLYSKGMSLARIRQTLGLDITLTRMQTIVNKP